MTYLIEYLNFWIFLRITVFFFTLFTYSCNIYSQFYIITYLRFHLIWIFYLYTLYHIYIFYPHLQNLSHLKFSNLLTFLTKSVSTIYRLINLISLTILNFTKKFIDIRSFKSSTKTRTASFNFLKWPSKSRFPAQVWFPGSSKSDFPG